jgi:hemoglobin
MNDIQNRDDLTVLMKSFYSKALTDELIGHYFTEVIALNMEEHIDRIVDFWESVVFEKGNYRGDVLTAHEKLHEVSPFKDEYFKRWVSLFKETVDDLYEGAKATLIKQRGESIATVMNIKLVHGSFGLK